MIAMHMMSPRPMRHALARSTNERESEHAGTLQADEPAEVAMEFRRLDAAIVSEAIPTFFLGRNSQGFWVARDANGRIGGIFLLESSALSFARSNSRPKGCATIFPSNRFELDLENNGNPLVPHLASLMRIVTHLRRRFGEIRESVRHRLKDFHVL